jgi:hypothetical protein
VDCRYTGSGVGESAGQVGDCACVGAEPDWEGQAVLGGPRRLSDFGSGMGVARLGQAASDAVIVTVRRPLTCADAVTWAVGPVEHCVRIEGVRGSNPLSSTRWSSRFGGDHVHV